MQRLLKFQDKDPLKTGFLIIAGVSGLSVCISFFMEFVFGQIPCLLCLIQRGLHGLLFGIAAIGLFVCQKPGIRRGCQIVLIFSCAVAGYHALVQFKIVKDRCKTTSRVEDISSYKNLLVASGKNRPSCSENSWKIGVVPISVINGVVSFLLLSLSLSWLKKEILTTISKT